MRLYKVQLEFNELLSFVGLSLTISRTTGLFNFALILKCWFAEDDKFHFKLVSIVRYLHIKSNINNFCDRHIFFLYFQICNIICKEKCSSNNLFCTALTCHILKEFKANFSIFHGEKVNLLYVKNAMNVDELIILLTLLSK